MLFQNLLHYLKLQKLSLVLIINVTNCGSDRGRFAKFMTPGRKRKPREVEQNYSIQVLSQLERITLRDYTAVEKRNQRICRSQFIAFVISREVIKVVYTFDHR